MGNSHPLLIGDEMRSAGSTMHIVLSTTRGLCEILVKQIFILCARVNPFPPSVPIWQRLAKLSILILEGTIKKIFYERRDYESVDEKSLSLVMSRKTTKKRIQEVKG